MTANTATKINAYEIEWTWDHAQYWQGAGLAYSDFNNIATGFGWTPRVAFEDACDQIASGGASLYGADTSTLEFPNPEYLDQESLCECGEDDGCEHGYYVTIRFNTEGDDE